MWRHDDIRLCPEPSEDFQWSSTQDWRTGKYSKKRSKIHRAGGLKLQVLLPKVDSLHVGDCSFIFNPILLQNSTKVLRSFQPDGQIYPVAASDYHLFRTCPDGSPNQVPVGIQIAFLQKQF